MNVAMPRTDLYLKVVIDHDADDPPEKMASEICRQVEKTYGVRAAELSNFITRAGEE